MKHSLGVNRRLTVIEFQEFDSVRIKNDIPKEGGRKNK